jgi:DNA-directed RNA polymerase subunit beta
MSKRINLGKLKETVSLPNLIDNQILSFKKFLYGKQFSFNLEKQEKQLFFQKRKKKICYNNCSSSIEKIFYEFFPIKNNDETLEINFRSYALQYSPNYCSSIKCIKEGYTYSVSLYLKLLLKEKDKEPIKEEVYMGEIPIITRKGSFIVNGVERVVVNQLHRSPGICFESIEHTTGKVLYFFKIIPDRGTWIKVQFDIDDLLYVYLDRKSKRKRFLFTTLLKSLGLNSNEEIISNFYPIKEYNVNDDEMFLKIQFNNISKHVLLNNIYAIDNKTGNKKILGRRFDPITKILIKSCEKFSIKSIKVIDISFDGGVIIQNLKKDETFNNNEDFKRLYRCLRPGDIPSTSFIKNFVKKIFQNRKSYDLGRVGRYKLNQKLKTIDDSNYKSKKRILEIQDIVKAIKYLCLLKNGKGKILDIDHLGSRRVKTVGELLENQCRLGLSKIEKLAKDRMNLYDRGLINSINFSQKLINPKLLIITIRDFFARSQLSQFMDQINPLSELTHKRRLSALGPGGLNRDRAGFDVRDVHPSHYGRICPIETPEGPNIGLINSLSIYAKINKYGFIETPCKKVINGYIQFDKICYLTADQEENFYIAQSNTKFDIKSGKLIGPVVARIKEDFVEVDSSKIDYIDVSPKQIISIAAGLIPFLEHDDANRALMGSNMQRQAIPLLKTQSPFVGTGLEKQIAMDSRTSIFSTRDCKIDYVDSKKIVVTFFKKSKKNRPKEKLKKTYFLLKFFRTNASTCFNQKPIIKKNSIIKKYQAIADGSSTENGELALGYNVLVAFMPWNGYNFEDSILVSESLIKRDIYTSIHIDEFEILARDTKLGPEEITRDIPNVSEKTLRNLDQDGIIRIGSKVKSGDILVGKVSPKNETELSPEERLLRAIFGEKAADVKDTSLIAPSGVDGVVMDIKISSIGESKKISLSSYEKKRKIKKINEKYKLDFDGLKERLTESLSNILLGEKIPLEVRNLKTGNIIIPSGRKITKTLLRKLSSVYKHIGIDSSPIKIKIMGIINSFKKENKVIKKIRKQSLEKIKRGKNFSKSIIRGVKVYITSKRKLQVGDKMSGRHGNKGVVAKIVPEEDMPYLPDGTPIEMILNPLGVPSRMNVGQIMETHLGWACKKLKIKVSSPVFDGLSEFDIKNLLSKAKLPKSGKTVLFDGYTGDPFDQKVTVGYMYMMKLNHLVADKIHARAVGPYSLITQQPLGGKAQYGGQRFGEMEVWALESYGSAYTLQELLTIKSDDVKGRTKVYEQLVKGDNILQSGVPQSFNVLVKEIKSLGLNIKFNELSNKNTKLIYDKNSKNRNDFNI